MKGCQLFVGGRTAGGYGTTRGRDGALSYAHRAAWEAVNGPISPGMFVCHHCDNPPCVNPEHLFLGTKLDNMRDMIGKGRQIHPAMAGTGRGNSKLSWETVRHIRRSPKTGAALAVELGVHYSTISLVRRGKTWREGTQ